MLGFHLNQHLKYSEDNERGNSYKGFFFYDNGEGIQIFQPKINNQKFLRITNNNIYLGIYI